MREARQDVNKRYCDRHWLSHEINFFVLASRHMKENDFGLSNSALAIVNND